MPKLLVERKKICVIHVIVTIELKCDTYGVSAIDKIRKAKFEAVSVKIKRQKPNRAAAHERCLKQY